MKLAGDRRRGIHVHSMIIVPKDLPLDAKLEDKEAAPAARSSRRS